MKTGLKGAEQTWLVMEMVQARADGGSGRRAVRCREESEYQSHVETDLAGLGDDKGWWCQIHEMKTQVRTGLGRSREVDFSPGMLNLTSKCCLFP